MVRLLGAVVAEVDEDYHVALLNESVHAAVVDRLHELVGHALVIAVLHGLHHVGGLRSLALYQQVVGFAHALPALVAVHGIEAAHYRGYGGIVVGTHLLYLLYESLARLGVGVASVHEAVNEGLSLQTILLAHFDELEEVVERRVNASVGAESHEVELLARLAGILVSLLHLCVLHD